MKYHWSGRSIGSARGPATVMPVTGRKPKTVKPRHSEQRARYQGFTLCKSHRLAGPGYSSAGRVPALPASASPGAFMIAAVELIINCK